jgi:hypothetical protein
MTNAAAEPNARMRQRWDTAQPYKQLRVLVRPICASAARPAQLGNTLIEGDCYSQIASAILLQMQDRVPLYVRLPRDQAAALDRLVDATGQRKQHVVSELLADRLEVGRIDIDERTAAPAEEVLTLDELASWLRLPAEALEIRARVGDLPGRRIGGEWRFARAAVLEWLSEGEGARAQALTKELGKGDA